MGYKKTDIDWTDKFRGLMKSEGCRFICRDGYIFDNSSMCLKGDYEQRVSMMNSEEARAACQVLRYLARLTYCDFTTLMKEAQLFAEERKLPAVALDQNYISKLLKELIYLGAVSSRKYRDEKNFDDKLLNCFCMTGRGADLFKSMTEYSGYIEDMLINKNEIEVMRRLSVNYILTRLSSTISRLGGGGAEPILCHTEKFDKGGRHVVYGSVVGERILAVFEPVFYKRNVKVQTEEELLGHMERRKEFLTNYLKEVGTNKQKILVLVVEDISYLKKAYFDYKPVVDECDLIYGTHEVIVSSYQGSVGETAPFLKVIPDDEVEGNILIEAETPSFMNMEAVR